MVAFAHNTTFLKFDTMMRCVARIESMTAGISLHDMQLDTSLFNEYDIIKVEA